MGRVVYCPLSAISVTAAADQDIWELASTATNKLKLLSWEVTSSAIAAEALTVRLVRGTASGTGGGAVSEVKADTDDGAITGVVETLNTTPGTDGDILQTWSWEQLGPLGQVYTPQMGIIIHESSWIKLNLVTLPTAFTANGWICWEEI